VNKPEEYTRRIQASFDLGRPLVGPTNASLAVTKRCNSRCRYCPPARVDQQAGPTPEALSNVLTQLAALGVHRVSITGGEPLLRTDLEEVIAFAARLGLAAVVLTNGTLLTIERGRSLLAAGAVGFVVSLDSVHDDTYRAVRGRGIRDALRGVDVLAELKRGRRQVVACVTSVLTRYNVDELGELAHYLYGRGLGFQIQPCLDAPHLEIDGHDQDTIGKVEAALAEVRAVYGPALSVADLAYLDHIPSYLRDRGMPADYRCLAGYALVHLDADLNLYPCWLEPPVGSMRQQPLAELWFGEAMSQARWRFAEGNCTGCWLLCDVKPSLLYR
jgi:MoaA/NifB/PqqE/SkfB family radical SAM enzyme